MDCPPMYFWQTCLGEFGLKASGAKAYKTLLWSMNTCICLAVQNKWSSLSIVWATAYDSFSWVVQFLCALFNIPPRNANGSWFCCSIVCWSSSSFVWITINAQFFSLSSVYIHFTRPGLDHTILTALCKLPCIESIAFLSFVFQDSSRVGCSLMRFSPLSYLCISFCEDIVQGLHSRMKIWD